MSSPPLLSTSGLKRKKRTLVDDKSDKKKAKKSTDHNDEADFLDDFTLFSRWLKQSGLRLRKTPKNAATSSAASFPPHRLEASDPGVFAERLQKLFQRGEAEQRACFLREMRKYLEEGEGCVLLHALAPTQTARKRISDSPVRMLLLVDDAQTDLIEWLIDKLATMALDEDDEDADDDPVNVNAMSTPRQILHQLRHLNHVVDGVGLADRLRDVLQALPGIPARRRPLQHEIIEALADVVESGQHARLAPVLIDLMHEERALTSVVLSALTRLSVGQDVLADTKATLLKTMASVPPTDWRVVVDFVLQGVSASEAVPVVAELRRNLDITLTCGGSNPASQTAKQASLVKSAAAAAVLTLDVIQTSANADRHLAAAWIRAIDQVKKRSEMKPLDLLVLFALHSRPDCTKSVESVFKNKIRQGLIAEKLVEKTWKYHQDALKPHRTSILYLLDVLAQSHEPSLNLHAALLYRESFAHAPDQECRQDVIADLVGMIIRSPPGSCALRTRLKALHQLAHQHDLKPYDAFLNSLLSILGELELAEVTQLVEIASHVAFACSPGEERASAHILSDNLQIMLKKQLFSNSLKIRKMGVTTGVMMVKSLSLASNAAALGDTAAMNVTLATQAGSSTQASAANVATKKLLQAKDILKNVWRSSTTSADIGSLVNDELSSVILTKKMNKRFQKWVWETLTDRFQEDFIVDVNASMVAPDFVNNDHLVPVSLQYGLEDPNSEDSAGIALNVCPLVCQSSYGGDKKQSSNKVCGMIPHFRLVSICQYSLHNGNLEDIDALLVCPLWMPKRELVEKISSLQLKEQNVVCASLFYAVNWFLELLNSFANEKEQEQQEQEEAADTNRKKVINRIKHVIALQDDLVHCLQFHPTFVPPVVQQLVNISAWQPPVSAGARKDRKGAKGKAKSSVKKKKAATAAAAEETMFNINTQAGSQGDTVAARSKSQIGTQNEEAAVGASASSAIDLDHYIPFFRELDLDVFQVLSFDVVTIDAEPAAEVERRNPKLRPAELRFLLKDLQRKMEHGLVSSKTKKSFPGKSAASLSKNAGFVGLDLLPASAIAERGIELFDYLLGNLDVVHGYYQALIDDSDGVMDCAAIFCEATPVICDCTEMMFKILTTVLGWNGFLSSDQHCLLKKAVCALAKRTSPKAQVTHSLDVLSRSAIKHLAGFAKTVISIGCADALLRLLDVLCQYTNESDESRQLIAKLAEEYLKREWCTPAGMKDKGGKYNGHVELILKTRLAYEEEDMTVIDEYVSGEMQKVLESGGSNISEAFPTFNKQTLAKHYAVLFEHLVACAQAITFGVHKDHQSQLDQWSSVLVLLHQLVVVIRTKSTRIFIAVVLKNGRQFFQHFLKHCMPLLDKTFGGRQRADSIALLKNMQQTTRLLQHVCSHSKINQDTALSRNVPPLRKTLETIVYRVRAMLALNNADNAFWMGPLQNRNLDGRKLLSQSEASSTTEGEGEEEVAADGEEEEELPEEDQSDVDLDDEDEEI